MTNLSPVTLPVLVAAQPSRARRAARAAGWVVGLVWGLPLLVFVVAALLAPSSDCSIADNAGMPCDEQGAVVLYGVFSFALLVPLGLVLLVVVPAIAASLTPRNPTRPGAAGAPSSRRAQPAPRA
jgi:hypothetical protein